MSASDNDRACARECHEKAQNAQNADDKQSWLALADSFSHSAKLRQILEHQERIKRAAA
jgi:hypothetical protein